MNSFRKRMSYYFGSSNRRQCIDRLLKDNESVYTGMVLDLGGRERGRFKIPESKIEKRVFADINPYYQPDILTDVTDMKNVPSESFDTVNAIELFEHVEHIEKGLAECYRVLKEGGKFILTTPFLFQIHADPSDYQRWTEVKWRKELEKKGFKILKLEITGRYFTVINDLKKTFIRSLPVVIKHIAYLCFPILNLINRMDHLDCVKNHKQLGNFHGGYFIVAKKQKWQN
jgi:SAM-dependent methyltransferase